MHKIDFSVSCQLVYLAKIEGFQKIDIEPTGDVLYGKDIDKKAISVYVLN